MKVKKSIVWRTVGVLVLVLIIVLSIWQLDIVQKEYDKEAAVHQQMLEFKPADTDTTSAKTEKIVSLQKKYPDVIGWLTVNGTEIDYPFAQAEDNVKYLRHDLDFNKLRAGTVFMDYRCKSDFTSFNTVIYGHNMMNDTMFGSLTEFRDETFFDAHTKAVIYTADVTYDLNIFACMSTDSEDEQLYNFNLDSPTSKKKFLNYVKDNSEHYRNVGVDENSRIVTLSTCIYDFDGARLAVIATLNPRKA